MKKFLAGLLAAVMFFISADITSLAAYVSDAESHDAYAAWADLLAENIHMYDGKISAYANLLEEYQNRATSYSNMVYNGTSHTGWEVPNYSGKIQTNTDNRSNIQYFHQTGIQANAQYKAGYWLDDTTYDATAGVPTTENFYLTVGGTQYIVDIEYEFVSRPYVRRLWFTAACPNYRYYKIGDPTTMGTYSPMTNNDAASTGYDYTYSFDTQITTDWQNNAGTLLQKYIDSQPGNKNKYVITNARIALMLREMRLKTNDNGTALVANSVLNTGGNGALQSSANGHNLEASLSGLIALTGDALYEKTSLAYTNQQDWWKATKDANPDTSTMSPSILTAVSTKKAIATMIEDYKTQFKGLQDNYRADETAWDIDNPEYNSATWAYDRFTDRTYWNYTYYCLMRYSSNGVSYNYNNIPNVTSQGPRFTEYNYSDATIGVAKRASEGGYFSTRYTSNNPWDPIFTTYFFEWQGFGHASLNVPTTAEWVNSFYAPTYKPALWLNGNCCDNHCSTLEEFKINHILYPTNLVAGIDDVSTPMWGNSVLATFRRFSQSYMGNILSNNNFAIADNLYPVYWGSTKLSSEAAIVDGDTGYNNTLYTINLHSASDNSFAFNASYDFIYAVRQRVAKLFGTGDHYDEIGNYLANTYLAALNDGANIYLPGLPSKYNLRNNGVEGDAEGLPDTMTSNTNRWSDYTSDDETLYEYNSSDTIFNQMVCVYYTHIYDLFCNVSGLFYYDELEELFGGFPGLSLSALSSNKGAYNDKVAANLFLTFGDIDGTTRYLSGSGEDTISFNWTIPWAVFPPGGDMDGSMEDTDAHTLQSGFLGQQRPLMHTYPTQYTYFTSWEVAPVDVNVTTLTNIMQRSPQYVKWSEWSLLIDKRTSYPATNVNTPEFASRDRSSLWKNYYYLIHGNASSYPSHNGIAGNSLCADANSRQYHSTSSETHEDDTSSDPSEWGCSWHDSSCVCGGTGWGYHKHFTGWEEVPDNPDTPENEYKEGKDDWDEFRACAHAEKQHLHSPVPTGSSLNQNSHLPRTYQEHLEIQVRLYSTVCNYNAPNEWEDKNDPSHIDTTWTEEIRNMSYNSVLEQKFEDVQYLNILSWSVWALSSAKCYSLTSLLGQTVTLTNNNGTQSADGVVTTAKNTVLNIIGYDIDEKTIDDDHGDVDSTSGYWNSLEYLGRVYNSFNTNSDGITGPHAVSNGLKKIKNDTSYGSSATYRTLMVWRESDTPLFANAPGSLINDDPAAFKLQRYKYTSPTGAKTDDLYFVYTPLTQGGRSHSTFAGFVYQALAHTLYTSVTGDMTKLLESNNGSSEPYYTILGSVFKSQNNDGSGGILPFISHTYANTLRVQGDYLAIETSPGNYTTLVGSMYDLTRTYTNSLTEDIYYANRSDIANLLYTDKKAYRRYNLTENIAKAQHLGIHTGEWSQTATETEKYVYSNVFNLQSDNPYDYYSGIKAYASVTPWIPGRMAYVLGRANESCLTTGAPDGVIDSSNSWILNLFETTDCWVIHTYCYAINSAQYSFWDLPTNAHDALYQLLGIDWSPNELRYATLQGSVNPLTTPDFTLNLGEPTSFSYFLPEYSDDHRELGIKYDYRSHQWFNWSCHRIVIGSRSTWDVHLLPTYYQGPYNVLYNSSANSINVRMMTTDLLPKKNGFVADNISWDTLSITVPCLYAPERIAPFVSASLNTKLGSKNYFTSTSTTTWLNRNIRVLQTESFKLPIIGYQSAGVGTKNLWWDETSQYQDGYTEYYDSDFDPTRTMVSSGYNSFDSYFDTGGFEGFGANLTIGVYADARIDPGEIYQTGSKWHGSINATSGNQAPTGDTAAAEFSQYYPWLANLNINRYLPNGAYYTGTVQAVYTKIGEHRDSYTDDFPVTTRDDEILVNAKYHQGSSPYGTVTNRNDVPNSIVVYNPVSTESAHIIAMSEYMPDAANKGSDGKYLTAYLQLELRDQRVAQRSAGGSITSQEEIVTSDGTITTTQVQDEDHYHFEMRTENGYVKSAEESTSITMEDYDIQFTQSEVTTFGGSTGVSAMQITETGLYKFSVQNRTGQWSSCTVYLTEGDTVSFQDNFLLVTEGSSLFELTYSSWQQAYVLNQEAHGWDAVDTTNYVPIKGGQLFKPIDATFATSAGSVIRLDLYLEYTDTGIQPFHLDNFDYDNFDCLISHEAGSPIWTIYIESLNGSVLTAPTFAADIDFNVLRYEGSAVHASEVVLLHIADSTAMVEGITSLTSFYNRTNGETSWINESGYYNSTVVDASGEWRMEGVSMTLTEVVYGMLQNASISMSVDRSNPHKVPNTNWRYYVIGWKTVDGDIITDINDPRIAVGSEVELVPPIGLLEDTHITAAYLDNLANTGLLQVGKYNGEYYLAKLDNSMTVKRSLDWYGLSFTQWDLISFGEETTTITGTFLTTTLTSQTTVSQFAYEEVFKATGTTVYSIAYTVQYSANPAHKYAITSSNWNIDWVQVKDVVLQTVLKAHQEASSSYLSLDDEFLIYWDNLTDLVDGSNENNGGIEQRQISSILARGWDANTDDSYNVNHLSQSVKSILTNEKAAFTKEWWAPVIEAGSNITDTTKWIYSKYVTFNVDMYGFTQGASFELQSTLDPRTMAFDPTTPAFDPSTGEANNIVYIPAGTPVHLGYYLGDDAADNGGKFVDYGYDNSATKSPNGFYTYHFWVPLEVGESINNVTVEYHVTSINNNDAIAGQGTWEIPGVTKWERTPTGQFALNTGEKDEWGNDIIRPGFAYTSNNLHRLTGLTVNGNNTPGVSVLKTMTTSELIRPNDSTNVDTLSTVGRVGGLTIVDSGDPRWQDTFKYPDGTKFAIAPIVYAVTRYSNDNPGSPGTQRRFATDVADVRGRLWTVSEANYKLVKELNTYSSQLWRDLAGKYPLPISSKFNVHDEIDLPLQRLGYELYLSLDTIGNYYGSSSQRFDEATTNLNDDYGQTKIQIRPVYYYFEIDEDGTVHDPVPVDIYYRRNGNYTLLNAGSAYASKTEAYADGSSDSGPFYATAALTSSYAVSVSTNTELEWDAHTYYRLDQTLLRRMVTQTESIITYDVVKNIAKNHTNRAVSGGVTTTILEPSTLDTAEFGYLMDYNYYYGNPQMMWLRERNRTFEGGINTAIEDGGNERWTRNSELYGQKWYFGLGLPASSIFVRHGETHFTNETIINGKRGYILVTLDVYAIGEKWVLHYQSDISNRLITIGGTPFDSETWNVYHNPLPNLIPVSIYDTETMGESDWDTRGTF